MSVPKPLRDGQAEIYLGMLASHAAHLRSHYQGLDSYSTSGSSLSTVLPPSTFAPHSVWTSEEKNLLFRGLSIYSRHRPDCIAELIGSKSAPEVNVYIARLAHAAAEREAEEDAQPEFPSNTHHSSNDDPSQPHAPKRKSQRKVRRDAYPAARVLTKRWRLFEDSCADHMLTGEVRATRHAIEQERKWQCDEAGVERKGYQIDYALRRTLKRKRARIDSSDDEADLDNEAFSNLNAASVEGVDNGRRGRRAKRARLHVLQTPWIREDLLRTINPKLCFILEGIKFKYDHSAARGANREPDGSETTYAVDGRSMWDSGDAKHWFEIIERTGVNQEELERDGVGLFNHKAMLEMTTNLRALMRPLGISSYKDASGNLTLLRYEGDSKTGDIRSGLPYETLMLLSAYVRDYVREIIRRAIMVHDNYYKEKKRTWVDDPRLKPDEVDQGEGGEREEREGAWYPTEGPAGSAILQTRSVLRAISSLTSSTTIFNSNHTATSAALASTPHPHFWTRTTAPPSPTSNLPVPRLPFRPPTLSRLQFRTTLGDRLDMDLRPEDDLEIIASNVRIRRADIKLGRLEEGRQAANKGARRILGDLEPIWAAGRELGDKTAAEDKSKTRSGKERRKKRKGKGITIKSRLATSASVRVVMKPVGASSSSSDGTDSDSDADADADSSEYESSLSDSDEDEAYNKIIAEETDLLSADKVADKTYETLLWEEFGDEYESGVSEIEDEWSDIDEDDDDHPTATVPAHRGKGKEKEKEVTRTGHLSKWFITSDDEAEAEADLEKLREMMESDNDEDDEAMYVDSNSD